MRGTGLYPEQAQVQGARRGPFLYWPDVGFVVWDLGFRVQRSSSPTKLPYDQMSYTHVCAAT